MAAFPRAPSAEFPDASQPQMAFLDSTWFKTHGLKYSLPSPDQVRARCPRSGPAYSRPIARFDEFDLAVKFGDRVTTSEALCLRMVKRLLPTQVPVPEVYGWKVEQGQVFLYMQLIRGPTLLERWGSMHYQDRQSVCSHLRQILQSLRTIPQNPSKTFVGQYNSYAALLLLTGSPQVLFWEADPMIEFWNSNLLMDPGRRWRVSTTGYLGYGVDMPLSRRRLQIPGDSY